MDKLGPVATARQVRHCAGVDDDATRSNDKERHDRTRLVTQTLQLYPQLADRTLAAVDRNLAHLTDFERRFLARRFGFDGSGLETLKQLADEFEISWQRARQVEARALAKLLDPAMTWPQPTTVVLRWQLDAEVLLLRIDGLLGHVDALRSQLGATREDLYEAEARIRHLEDLNSILRRELYETGGSADRKWVGSVGALVLGLVGGFLGGVGQAGGEELLHALRDAETTAVVVVQNCGVELPDYGRGG